MSPNTKAIRELAAREYKWGFVTKIDEEGSAWTQRGSDSAHREKRRT